MSEELLGKDKIVAVVVADSFTSSFAPITLQCPNTLIPLCGVPVLDYTIEILIRSGVKEIYIFCCSQGHLVSEYIRKQSFYQVRPKVIINASCKSMGDVLRELDRKNVLSKEFLLIFGDVVGNASLVGAIHSHRERRKQNREYILTKVFKQEKVNSRIRVSEDQNILVLEGDRILQYDSFVGQGSIKLNKNVRFCGQKQFDIRFDLVDTGVNICSVEMLHYFSDNFDYMFIQEHLMKDILTSDIYTDKFAAYVLPNIQYIARAKTPKSVDVISKDFMHRWMHPICPEYNFSHSIRSTDFTFSRSLFYRDEGISIAVSAVIEAPCCLGKDSEIGENTVISKSVLGRECRVGNHCKIINSYLWERVTVKDHSTIVNSIICTNSTIGESCSVEEGSLVSFDCTLKDNTTLPAFSRYSLFRYDEQQGAFVQSQEESEYGKGHIFPVDESARVLQSNSICGPLNWLNGGDVEETVEDPDSHSDSGNEVSLPSRYLKTEQFIEEVKSTVIELISKGESIDLIQIEINRFKFDQDQNFTHCLKGVIAGLLECVADNPASTFAKWSELIEIYAYSETEKGNLIKELEVAVGNSQFVKHFPNITKALYDSDVVDGEVILQWNKTVENEEIKELMRPFVEWLAEDDDSD